MGQGAEGPVLTSRPPSQHSHDSEVVDDAVVITGEEPSQDPILAAHTQGIHPHGPDIETVENLDTVGDNLETVGDTSPTVGEELQGTDHPDGIETYAQVYSPPRGK